MRVLIIDIETSPNLAYVWRFFKENISPKQVKETSTILSYAAKWLGEDEVIYNDCRKDLDEVGITLEMASLIDEADVLVAHNGKKFDLPKINTACLRNGITPPSPVKVVDTLLTARKQFCFDSNSLEHLANHLSLSHKKLAHKKYPGFDLWLECLKGNEEAWEEMREYNINDILVLEELYLMMRPWMPQHPNFGVTAEDEKTLCPKCGSHDIHYRGYAHTTVSKFRRFRCNSCGGWGRLRFSEFPKAIRKALAVNAA